METMPDESDSEEFRRLIGEEVQPLKKPATIESPPRSPKLTKNNDPVTISRTVTRRSTKQSTARQQEKISTKPGKISGTDAEEKYMMAGVSARQFKAWEKQTGKNTAIAELDLHGDNKEQAEQKIKTFLQTMHHKQQTTCRIIHGRGQRSLRGTPVLRQLTRAILKDHPVIKGYTTKAGGGVTMAWLKN